jgi:hypothetical protein
VPTPRWDAKRIDYCLGNPAFALVPIEELGTSGVTATFAARLADRRGWSKPRVALFDAAFERYWQRCTELARRAPPWPVPRVRHVVAVTDAAQVRPYAQILNTTAWTLHDGDLDPEHSDPELAAWLLAIGDWMARTGDVSLAPLRAAAWWFERSEAECDSFLRAATASTRPDAAVVRAVAAAIPWLRHLYHAELRPAPRGCAVRAVPGTGLLVPREIEHEPVLLAARCRVAAEETLAAHRARWRAAPSAEIERLCGWLAAEAPRVLLVGEGGRLLWDPERPSAIDSVVAALDRADAIAVASIHADLRTIDRNTRQFFDGLVDPSSLPGPPYDLDRGGYCYLHPDRGFIAYELHEPGMERLAGPPLPYARAMLGARTAHEWGHVADAAGWVVLGVSILRFEATVGDFAAELGKALAEFPVALRRDADTELAALSHCGVENDALVRLLLTRLPDWRANLVARRFMTFAERETYARHNVRSLGAPEASTRLLRRLVRYLYEMQYVEGEIGLSVVPDGRSFFVRSTGFGDEFLGSGALSEVRFHALADATHRVLSCFAVDAARFRVHSRSSQ